MILLLVFPTLRIVFAGTLSGNAPQIRTGAFSVHYTANSAVRATNNALNSR
jgi:hypothetical protein